MDHTGLVFRNLDGTVSGLTSGEKRPHGVCRSIRPGGTSRVPSYRLHSTEYIRNRP